MGVVVFGFETLSSARLGCIWVLLLRCLGEMFWEMYGVRARWTFLLEYSGLDLGLEGWLD